MGEPARLPHERVAVEQDERRVLEPLDHRLEPAGIGERKQEVAVAEAAVHLDGERVARLLVGLEHAPERMILRESQAAAVGRDRLQRGKAVRACGTDVDLGARSRLDTQDGT